MIRLIKHIMEWLEAKRNYKKEIALTEKAIAKLNAQKSVNDYRDIRCNSVPKEEKDLTIETIKWKK